jgi:hypothetical protein
MSSKATVGRQGQGPPTTGGATAGGRSDAASPQPGILPQTKTARRTSLSDLSVLIYGPSKIGKSTFCANAPDVLFLATEPGLNALEAFQVPITSWGKFLDVCAAVEAGDHPFQVIVIDTVDNLHKLAAEHVRKTLGITHEADASYGKGFGLVNDELHRVLTKLAFLPYGLILVSHAEEREVTTRTGKITRVVPSLPDKARRIVLALVGAILFVELDESRSADGQPQQRRVIRTTPHPRYEAGDRTGLLPPTLDLDFPTFHKALEGGATNE